MISVTLKIPVEIRLESVCIKRHFCIDLMTILVSHQAVPLTFCNKIALMLTIIECLGVSLGNVGNDLPIYFALMVISAVEIGHFLNVRSYDEQRRTIRQNMPNSLIPKRTEHEYLCEIDTTSVINKFAMAKSRKCNLKL